MEEMEQTDRSKLDSKVVSVVASQSKSTVTSNLSTNYEVPDFFLYTTLNQNQTKDLRKAQTNREERKVLNTIFGLNGLRS